jgi:hypothetical protein
MTVIPVKKGSCLSHYTAPCHRAAKAPVPTTTRGLERSESTLPSPAPSADGDPHRRHPPPPVLARRGRQRPLLPRRRGPRPTLPQRRPRRRGLRRGHLHLLLGGAPVRALRRRRRVSPWHLVRPLRLLWVSQARGEWRMRRRRRRLP